MYQQYGKEPAEEYRPSKSIFASCQNVKRQSEEYTELIVNEICVRWQTTRLLHSLYHDPNVVADFNDFRRYLPTVETGNDTFRIVSPGGFPAMSAAQKLEGHSPDYGENSRVNFHKSLCLQSMAIATRTLAIAIHSESLVRPSVTSGKLLPTLGPK